jgi:hypothetical protein
MGPQTSSYDSFRDFPQPLHPKGAALLSVRPERVLQKFCAGLSVTLLTDCSFMLWATDSVGNLLLYALGY